jgi:hypothetical protein
VKISKNILIVLCFAVLWAHFSRAGVHLLAWASLAFPLLLFVRHPWSAWTLRIALVIGGVEWLRTLARLVSERRAVGEEWLRLAVILVVVALVTFLAARVVRIPPASPEIAAAD